MLLLRLPVIDLLFETVDTERGRLDLLAVVFVLIKHRLVVFHALICVLLVAVELKLEAGVQRLNLLDKLVLHAL